jgi:hypothetical protein
MATGEVAGQGIAAAIAAFLERLSKLQSQSRAWRGSQPGGNGN